MRCRRVEATAYALHAAVEFAEHRFHRRARESGFDGKLGFDDVADLAHAGLQCFECLLQFFVAVRVGDGDPRHEHAVRNDFLVKGRVQCGPVGAVLLRAQDLRVAVETDDAHEFLNTFLACEFAESLDQFLARAPHVLADIYPLALVERGAAGHEPCRLGAVGLR